MKQYGTLVEWYWQGKTEVFGEKPVPAPHFTPQLSHGIDQESKPGLRFDRRATNAWATSGHLHVFHDFTVNINWLVCQMETEIGTDWHSRIFVLHENWKPYSEQLPIRWDIKRLQFFFIGEGPRSRCYRRTAALRLIVQTYDEDY
jgi:hypothetical protein